MRYFISRGSERLCGPYGAVWLALYVSNDWACISRGCHMTRVHVGGCGYHVMVAILWPPLWAPLWAPLTGLLLKQV